LRDRFEGFSFKMVLHPKLARRIVQTAKVV